MWLYIYSVSLLCQCVRFFSACEHTKFAYAELRPQYIEMNPVEGKFCHRFLNFFSSEIKRKCFLFVCKNDCLDSCKWPINMYVIVNNHNIFSRHVFILREICTGWREINGQCFGFHLLCLEFILIQHSVASVVQDYIQFHIVCNACGCCKR